MLSITAVHSRRQIMCSTVAAAMFLASIFGCAPPRTLETPETVTVEGQVTARGQEPFAEYVLETEEGNLYVLQFSDEASATFSTPSRMRISGRLYAAVWNGRPMAHVDVKEWERAP